MFRILVGARHQRSFAVAIGLLQYGRQSFEEQQVSQKLPTESIFNRIKAWFKGEF